MLSNGPEVAPEKHKTTRSKGWLDFGCRTSYSKCAVLCCLSVGTIGSSLVGKIVFMVRLA